MAREEQLSSLISETEPMLPKGFVLEVERDLAGSGKFAILRKLALTYLERTFPQTMEDMRSNRDFAVASAHIADVLKGAIRSHEALVGLLQAAELRLHFAVAAAREEDYDAVIAEAREASERVRNDELHMARFIKQLKRSR